MKVSDIARDEVIRQLQKINMDLAVEVSMLKEELKIASEKNSELFMENLRLNSAISERFKCHPRCSWVIDKSTNINIYVNGKDSLV